MNKEEYYQIAYKYLGLAKKGGHTLGTFLPEEVLDEIVSTRLEYLHQQLQASRVFKPSDYNYLSKEQKELVLDTYYLWANGVRTRYVLRYQRFLYLLRNLKTYPATELERLGGPLRRNPARHSRMSFCGRSQ